MLSPRAAHQLAASTLMGSGSGWGLEVADVVDAADHGRPLRRSMTDTDAF